MKVSKQSGFAASEGNHFFGSIRRNISIKEKIIIPLCKAIIRHRLEYCKTTEGEYSSLKRLKECCLFV